MEYTVGFIFTPTFDRVLLVHKNRPDWQVGKLNGIGGKFEEGETTVECIVREVQEESGLHTSKDQWRYIAREVFEINIVHFLATVYEGDVSDARTMTDEPIEWVSLDPLPDIVIPNLRYLLLLSIDMLKGNHIKEVVIDCRV